VTKASSSRNVGFSAGCDSGQIPITPFLRTYLVRG
jgi:hypothetical protein